MTTELLLIEDDEDIRDMIKEFIYKSSATDIEIIEAPNGLVGFNLLNKSKPDIIVTDLGMPEMNGLELMKLLELKNIKSPVLIYSGRDDFQPLARRFEFVKIFSKPHELNSLISEIERLAH